MPYGQSSTRKYRGGGFRTGPRRRARSTRASGRGKVRAIAWKKPTAMNQKKQIYTLQKQVNTLKKKTSSAFQYTKFNYTISTIDLLPPITRAEEDNDAFNVFNLMQPNSWEEIFSTNETVVQQKQCYVTNVRIEAYFTPKNSVTALTQKWVNVWLVSLHKEAASQCLNQTNNLITTQNNNGLNAQKQGEFYYTRNSNGPYSSMPLLNPKVFKIHQHRRFSIGNIMQEEAQLVMDDDIPVHNYHLATKRMLMNQRLNTKIATQTGIHGTAETWKDLNQFQIEQTDRLFLITHIGGYAEDTDNGVNLAPHVTFTVKTVR